MDNLFLGNFYLPIKIILFIKILSAAEKNDQNYISYPGHQELKIWVDKYCLAEWEGFPPKVSLDLQAP